MICWGEVLIVFVKMGAKAANILRFFLVKWPEINRLSEFLCCNMEIVKQSI